MPNFERKVLVLDSRYEPVKVCTIEAGFVYLYSGRADSVVDSKRTIRGVTRTYSIPWIIRLTGCAPKARHSLTPRLSRQNIYLRDEYRCQYCLITFPTSLLTLDHLIPTARGGKTTWENVVSACKPCNHRKGARMIEELGLKLYKKPIRPVFQQSWLFVLRYGLTSVNIPTVWSDYVDLSFFDRLSAPLLKAE